MIVTRVLFATAILLAVFFTSCKHETDEAMKDVSDPPVGFDTTWTSLPSETRIGGKVYFHNDVQNL